MNPDDTNQNPAASPVAPVADPMAPAAPAAPVMGEAPVTEPMAPAADPMAPVAESAPAASMNCHCGKPADASGNCTGCSMPQASCSCQPAAPAA